MALYVLLRLDLATMNPAMLIAVSKIAGEHGRKTDTLLRASLSSITAYTTAGGNDPEFCGSVVKLVDGLKQILRDTLEMQR